MSGRVTARRPGAGTRSEAAAPTRARPAGGGSPTPSSRSWTTEGYPLSVATAFRVDADRGRRDARRGGGRRRGAAAGPRGERGVQPHPSPARRGLRRTPVRLDVGHARGGEGDGLALTAERVQRWDEQDMTFFEFSERGVPQAQRYMRQALGEQGRRSGRSSRPGGSSCGPRGCRSCRRHSCRWRWAWRSPRTTVSGTGGSRCSRWSRACCRPPRAERGQRRVRHDVAAPTGPTSTPRSSAGARG